MIDLSVSPRGANWTNTCDLAAAAAAARSPPALSLAPPTQEPRPVGMLFFWPMDQRNVDVRTRLPPSPPVRALLHAV